MSTIWDRAVRALQPVFGETVGTFGGTPSPLSYYCGGPDRQCEHRTCAAVSALAEADLLNYGPSDIPARPSQCPVVYTGEHWEPSRCREVADHQIRAHVDRYEWSGVSHADQHDAHDHHVDQFGRTWGAS